MKEGKAAQYQRTRRAKQAAHREKTILEGQQLPAVRERSGPLSLRDVHAEMLARAGVTEDTAREAVDEIKRIMSNPKEDSYAKLKAAQMLLSMLKFFPSKNEKSEPTPVAIQVNIAPYARARVVEAVRIEPRENKEASHDAPEDGVRPQRTRSDDPWEVNSRTA